MPSETSTCSYSYEALLRIEPDGRIEVTRPDPPDCPHPVADTNTERCLYHYPDPDYPTDRFTEEFLGALADPDRPATFAGGQLPGLDLADRTITTAAGDLIDLRGATIDGDLDLSNATIQVPVLLDDAAIRGALNASGAEFRAPISLVGVDVGRRIDLKGAHLDSGIVANGVDLGLLDCRGLTSQGPLVLDGADFSSNVRLARATIEADLSLADASFDYRLDGTALSVAGQLTLEDATLQGDLDVIAATIAEGVAANHLEVEGETDWRHTSVEGPFMAKQAHFEGEATFDDLQCSGRQVTFDAAHFGGYTSFSTARFDTPELSFVEIQTGDEFWVVDATVQGRTSFEGATFDGVTHLRDTRFGGDLSVAAIRAGDSLFLAGAEIEEDLSATDAEVVHFQFSASVRGDADFQGMQFDKRAVFARSEFGGQARFDDASFAGHPDFSDARFTGQTFFDGTEFLVEPTFEETRFAVDPDLEGAVYPDAAARDLDERRRQMILARPESLQHSGLTIERTAVEEDLVIPMKTDHLIDDDLDRTRVVSSVLSDLEYGDWKALFGDAIQTARTAVTQVPDVAETILVFGVIIDPDAETAATFLEAGSIVGVYGRGGDTIEFGHLEPDLSTVDYLLPVPASDAAFEAGASVAILGELKQAMLRHQTFRAAMLAKRNNDGPNVNTLLVPILVATAEVHSGSGTE